MTTVPARCASYPPFAEARASAQAKLGAVVGVSLAARSTHIPTVTAASLLARSDVYVRETATLVRDNPSFIELLASGFGFTTDPKTEALLVVSYARAESNLELRREGSVGHVYVARARPCLDDESTAAAAAVAQEVMVAAVPSDIASVELHAVEVAFTPALPVVKEDGCTREGTVFSGGGRAAVLTGTPSTLYVEGFSAMTGNIFETSSSDGTSWAPGGWDQDHLLSFDARGPYADVYSPSPIRLGATLFLYASTLPIGRPAGTKPRISRFARVEGVHFGAAEDVLLPTTSGWDSGGIFSPSVLQHGAQIDLYYASGSSDSELRRIGLATSNDDGATFARRGSTPRIGPEAFPYGVSSIMDPDVHVVGDHLEMWCTVSLSGGNPSARLSTAIAHLTSSDGLTWTADPEPLVVPRGDAERGGLIAPTAIVRADGVTLFATAINERNEPLVERLSCRRR